MIPKTVEEWSVYISGLSNEDLLGQSRSANSLEFVNTLKSESLQIEDISSVLTLFAEELQRREMLLISTEGYISYTDLL